MIDTGTCVWFEVNSATKIMNGLIKLFTTFLNLFDPQTYAWSQKTRVLTGYTAIISLYLHKFHVFDGIGEVKKEVERGMCAKLIQIWCNILQNRLVLNLCHIEKVTILKFVVDFSVSISGKAQSYLFGKCNIQDRNPQARRAGAKRWTSLLQWKDKKKCSW